LVDNPTKLDQEDSDQSNLDISSNRQVQKYSRSIMILRVLWIFGAFIFRLSPRPCFGFRRWMLRRFGAKVGQHVHIYPSAEIYMPWNLTIGDYSAIGEKACIYNLGPCVIGERATISQRAHLCGGSHDYTDPTMPLLKLPIQIGDESWVCADAFIGPGITIGKGAVVGARAVVTRNIESWSVAAGNPATVIKKRTVNDA